MDRSRKAAAREKQRKNHEEMEDEFKVLAYQEEVNKKMDEEEEANKRRQKLRAKDLCQFQLKQAELKRRAQVQERLLEVKNVADAKNADAADQLEFHAYAESLIVDYATDGKNVVPLIKSLQAFKPNK